MMIRSTAWDRLRRATPYRARRWLKSQPWFFPITQRLFGNSVYSKSYYEDVERLEAQSVPHIAQWIVETLHPRRAIDVGCGPGHFMFELMQRGVDVFGVDISAAALRRAAEKGLRVEAFDLTLPGRTLPGAPYDLAISCEVAEHLKPEFAPAFVAKLTDAADVIFLTAAEPDPANGVGLFHFNEQPNEYWIRLMAERSFVLDKVRTDSARSTLARPDVVSYLQRPMVFSRERV